ncbi:MAG: beta-ketoacyl-ACP reductase [Spirochaetes bacterium GWF1_41_5]|nr:MAG: beta-ketoacyl-ACP reductase [Spirochaetes bacterium GWF1_41_5]HBE02688.1 3-oxoacyl-ACP reductase FabG [Spirochaetia bacterium]
MKTALVTGASRGIGKSIALTLAENGFHVIINYRSNDTEALKTLDEIKQRKKSAELLKFDIADPVSVENILGKYIETHTDDYISILVNNAGIRHDNLMVFMNPEQWSNTINTNLNSFFYVTRLLLKNMLTGKFGRIINIASLSGLKGLPGQTNYSASKGGLIAATKALAQEVGKKNVTVNAVAPGFIKTDMTDGLDEKNLKSMIPLQRFGEAHEVADLVAFLASEKSSYITGEVISINGGLY